MLTERDKQKILRVTSPVYRDRVLEWAIETDVRRDFLELVLNGHAEAWVNRGDVTFRESVKVPSSKKESRAGQVKE